MVTDSLPAASSRSIPGGVREVARLAHPIVLTQLSTTAMFLVDSAMVGRLGASELAGVGFGGIWLWTSLCFFFGFASGVQTFVAQAHGAGDSRRCGGWAWQGLYAVWPLALAGIFVFALVLEPLLRLLGPSAQIQDVAASYVRARLLGPPALVMAMLLAAFFRGIGDTRTPLYAMLTANCINAALAYGLIFGKLGLPELGVAGAGLATAAAEWANAAFLVVAMLRRPLAREFGTWPTRPDARAVLRFARTSAPIGGQWLLDMSAFALFSTLVARMGDLSMAASQAFLNLLSLSFMQAIGISIAASTLVGRYVGAQDLERARRSHRSAMKLGLVLATAVALLFLTLPELLLRIFSDDPAVLALGRPLLRLGAAFQLIDAVGIIAGGSLRGAGDTRWPLLVQTALAWGVRLPLAYLFGITLAGGLLGAWLGELFYLLALALAFVGRFRSGAWQRLRI